MQRQYNGLTGGGGNEKNRNGSPTLQNHVDPSKDTGREMEADGFLIRHDYQEVPPRVEYTLSALGASFIDVIRYMKQWGERNLPDCAG